MTESETAIYDLTRSYLALVLDYDCQENVPLEKKFYAEGVMDCLSFINALHTHSLQEAKEEAIKLWGIPIIPEDEEMSFQIKKKI